MLSVGAQTMRRVGDRPQSQSLPGRSILARPVDPAYPRCAIIGRPRWPTAERFHGRDRSSTSSQGICDLRQIDSEVKRLLWSGDRASKRRRPARKQLAPASRRGFPGWGMRRSLVRNSGNPKPDLHAFGPLAATYHACWLLRYPVGEIPYETTSNRVFHPDGTVRRIHRGQRSGTGHQ